MKKRFQRWFSSEPQKPLEAPIVPRPIMEAADERVTAQRELQALRMEVEARDQRITQLTQEVARLRERQESVIAETVTARLETLIGEMAAPASQICTQAYLAEDQNKTVKAQDVLAVARRLVRALERHGVTFEGEVGMQVSYDPNLQTLINAGTSKRSGDPVTVRFAGVRYQGKMIYKAMVE